VFTGRFRLAACLLLVAACAGNPSPASEPVALNAASDATARKSDIITAEELADPVVNLGDALEAVRRLRPSFLVTRGSASFRAGPGTVHLSIDGGSLLPVENLSRLRPNGISEIRYLSAPDAAQRFGTSAGSGGVILVKTRP
jgi:hypothetical protein